IEEIEEIEKIEKNEGTLFWLAPGPLHTAQTSLSQHVFACCGAWVSVPARGQRSEVRGQRSEVSPRALRASYLSPAHSSLLYRLRR
ncbi:MAG TPA: hypothetical protein DEW46_18235, partial [Verrucomicrobia bacterium]|nr:hypothetical protein [Verrucomicrobiota bacterium]